MERKILQVWLKRIGKQKAAQLANMQKIPHSKPVNCAIVCRNSIFFVYLHIFTLYHHV